MGDDGRDSHGHAIFRVDSPNRPKLFNADVDATRPVRNYTRASSSPSASGARAARYGDDHGHSLVPAATSINLSANAARRQVTPAHGPLQHAGSDPPHGIRAAGQTESNVTSRKILAMVENLARRFDEDARTKTELLHNIPTRTGVEALLAAHHTTMIEATRASNATLVEATLAASEPQFRLIMTECLQTVHGVHDGRISEAAEQQIEQELAKWSRNLQKELAKMGKADFAELMKQVLDVKVMLQHLATREQVAATFNLADSKLGEILEQQTAVQAHTSADLGRSQKMLIELYKTLLELKEDFLYRLRLLAHKQADPKTKSDAYEDVHGMVRAMYDNMLQFEASNDSDSTDSRSTVSSTSGATLGSVFRALTKQHEYMEADIKNLKEGLAAQLGQIHATIAQLGSSSELHGAVHDLQVDNANLHSLLTTPHYENTPLCNIQTKSEQEEKKKQEEREDTIANAVAKVNSVLQERRRPGEEMMTIPLPLLDEICKLLEGAEVAVREMAGVCQDDSDEGEAEGSYSPGMAVQYRS